MKIERALQGFLVFSSVAAATVVDPHVVQLEARRTCGWRCSIQKQINNIQQQLDWIAAQLWSFESESEDFPDSHSNQEKPTPARFSKSFGNPTPPAKPPSSVGGGSKPAQSSPEKGSRPNNKPSNSQQNTRPRPNQQPEQEPESQPAPEQVPEQEQEPAFEQEPEPQQEPEQKPQSEPKPKPQQPSIPDENMGGGDGYRSVAYFVNWGIYGRKYTPDKIPVEKLTHILYAFADNNEDGTVKLTDTWSDVEIHYPTDSWNDVGNNLYGNMKQLNIFKRRNRNLKVMLSIGGWTYTNVAKHFDTPAGSPEGRKQFAKTCVDLIRDLGFDGIDLDWEYPQNEGQGEQLVLLLKEIRKAMDEYAESLASAGYEKPYFELSIAAPAGKTNYDNLPLGKVGEAVDFINLMGYDFAGAWDKTSGHQANLYPSTSCPSCTPFNVDGVIKDYTAAGIPSSKIVLGMPLYGRTFTNTKGIGQAYEGVGEGSWEKGIWDYKVLPQQGAKEYYDEEAGASYSYDSNTQTLVSYDTIDMANKKVEYIKQNGLGGAMWWELSGDRDDEGSIISNVVAALGGSDGGKMEVKPNNINYPDSKYENLKAGFPNDS